MSKKNRTPVVETNPNPELNQAEAKLVEEAEKQEAQVQEVEAQAPSKKKGIGKRIVELLKGGMEPKTVLEEILKEFGSKTTIACVYWYKSKINKGFY
jgi:hypothetical protein